MPTHGKMQAFRRELLAQPFPKDWEAWLSANMTHYRLLNNAEQARLQDDARVLIANEIVPRRMALQIRVLVVVEPGALQELVFHREAERLDEVQPRPGVRGEPDHVARVGRNLGMNKNDVEHQAGGGAHTSS